MSEPAILQRQRAAVRDLFRLIATRAAAAPAVEREAKARIDLLSHRYDADYQAAIARFASEKEASERTFQETREHLARRIEHERGQLERHFAAARDEVLERYDAEKEPAKEEFHESRWGIQAVYEGNKASLDKEHKEMQRRLTAGTQRLQAIEEEMNKYLAVWGVRDAPAPGGPAPAHPDADPFRAYQDACAAAEAQLQTLQELRTPKLCQGPWLILIAVGLTLPCVGLAYLFTDSPFALLGLAAAPGVWAVLRLWLRVAARGQVRAACEPLGQTLREAGAAYRRCREHTLDEHKARKKELKRRCTDDLRACIQGYRKSRREMKQRRDAAWQAVVERSRRERVEKKQLRDAAWKLAVTTYRKTQAGVKQELDQESKRLRERYDADTARSERQYQEEWARVADAWAAGLARLQAAVRDVNQEMQRHFPDWTDAAWAQWRPADRVPFGVRFGDVVIDLEQTPHGVPEDPRLARPEPTRLTLPALLSFPDHGSLLFQADGPGRLVATQELQTVMMRYLTALPPGKVRFTILDPVGLGQNFAAFMHLADHDEALVTSRIWTEVAHVEQRLADLTAHMETVIQKYLRNQFATIEDYNAHAGEVAEPYRILVVANFPVNFSAEAIRRLVSVVNSGPRCGVYTLITADTAQPLPPGFSLADLEAKSVNLAWQEGQAVWRDPDFQKFPLRLEPPPPPELSTRLIQVLGALAKEAKRVEVPFDFIAPTPDQYWSQDSRGGLRVPLGRAGATKRQHLQLGQGTSQHVLIAGKTGSGKSTLLHALVTNAALFYSPEELELFLIDFKKGVEFKTYATHELPHARVVAIESEREFGLSVLQRLDAELRLRGDLFRDTGSQNVAAYRDATGNKMPRILLIVDEFQEFFVEDDKISQDAAQLLDRLVRQGRAFGLHVLLGSQTLGGAYSLARSTIDQMAVRVALQCSEADAHLILSDDNSAARLLSRPGEAIYNDANGLVEGNNPFQVVWLPDERREQYLAQLADLARARKYTPSHGQIVFEGNAPADVGKNLPLARLLAAPTWPEPARSVPAWLGEAMAIKDPTAAPFRAQSGCNLLITGQADDAALGMEVTALVSLAAHHPARGAAGTRFYFFDGSPADAGYAGLIPLLPDLVPHPFRLAGWRELPDVLSEIAAEVERRQQNADAPAPPWYLFVHGLQRFRDLRKAEDDYGFGRRDDKPNPAKQFATVLREGPALGVHAVVWCDSYNNLTRALDRQTLREFDLRVLFQMSAGDSSNLIDSPLASKLGLHRALFYNEEQGRLEKFRPYGLPGKGWLEAARRQCDAKQPGG